MIRVAVVGMGLMGMLHARILNNLRDVEVVGAVDISDERLDAVKRELAIPVYKDLAAVMDEVDAVSVTLPDELHVAACTSALQAGKFVLVEKPLATTVADARKILDAQLEPNRLMVGQLLRFDLRLGELKRRMDAGQFGRIEFVKVHRANGRAAVARLKGRASVTAFLGVHDLDLLLWLTGGSIAKVQAMGRKVFSGQWDLSLAHIELDNGVIASVENHWLIHAASARSAFAGIQVFGDKGTASLDLSTDELELATDELGMTRRIDSRNWSHDGGLSGGSLRRELESWIEAIRSGEPMPVSGEEGLRAVTALNMVEAALDRQNM
ncbi:MAG TPA: Gfo/Idh/MocA family oxidoreductase [Rhizobiaceae bacterium]|nr:Gfo/Idh/MocA family oxidoreductase [Rhizobiaceae bacterium]